MSLVIDFYVFSYKFFMSLVIDFYLFSYRFLSMDKTKVI